MELMATCWDKLIKKINSKIPENILGKISVAVSVNNKYYSNKVL